MYVVPADEDQALIPFSRVNHNKYVVTDVSTHIGTSNWSGDYFIASGGVGFVAKPANRTGGEGADLRMQVASVFERDWNSEYSLTLEEVFPDEYPTPLKCTASSNAISSAISFMFLVHAMY